MLISARLPPSTPMPSSTMTIYDNSIDYSHKTNSIPLISATSLPRYFNVPFAIQHGYFRCIRYLLQLNYDPNERDAQLRTPLILCAYVENNRWSLSLTQNLLEKGAKIALEDHARRNALHHACALQRLELVQLYLSCLDYNIDAKDYEGNTCLHYAAITGNCAIAELLLRAAEKVGIHLDQYVNREGCSAAVLALKYEHIECANQITHRDSDEFFVIPRPLSIYENLPALNDNQPTTMMPSKNKHPNVPHLLSTHKTENRPSTLSFGLLKIIFNESDTGYTTHLANLCRQDKQILHGQHTKSKKQETSKIKHFNRIKSTVVDSARYSSTQALVNDSSSSHQTKKRHASFDSNEILLNSDQISPRIQIFMHQQRLANTLNSKDNSLSFIQATTSKIQLSSDDTTTARSNYSKNDYERLKGRTNIPSIYQQITNSTPNQLDDDNYRHPTTIVHNQISTHPAPCQSSPSKKQLSSIKKKPVLDPIGNLPQQNRTSLASQLSAQPGRRASGMIHRSTSKSTDLSYPIREAKGATSRYNKPEELFGLRPEQLFGLEQYQPKILDQRTTTTKTDENKRLKRNLLQKQQQQLWQQDVSKMIDLYSVQQSVNYRKSAAPPLSSIPGIVQTEIATEPTHTSRPRRMSITKQSSTSSKQPTNPKQSTFAALNIPRRNSISRPAVKLPNT